MYNIDPLYIHYNTSLYNTSLVMPDSNSPHTPASTPTLFVENILHWGITEKHTHTHTFKEAFIPVVLGLRA